MAENCRRSSEHCLLVSITESSKRPPHKTQRKAHTRTNTYIYIYTHKENTTSRPRHKAYTAGVPNLWVGNPSELFIMIHFRKQSIIKGLLDILCVCIYIYIYIYIHTRTDCQLIHSLKQTTTNHRVCGRTTFPGTLTLPAGVDWLKTIHNRYTEVQVGVLNIFRARNGVTGGYTHL